MFKFALFALIAVAAVCSANESSQKLFERKEAHEECKKETGFDGEAFRKALLDEQAPDEKAKQYALCYGAKIGLTDDEGKPSLDKMKKMLKEIYPDTAADLIQKCIFIGSGDDEEVAFTIARCLAQEMEKN